MKKIFFILLLHFSSLSSFCQEGNKTYEDTVVVHEEVSVVEVYESGFTPDPVYDPKYLEVAPQFPGGDTALLQFLSEKVTYPERERNSHIQGKVFILFVIEKDGSITHAEVYKDVLGGPGLTQEALRVTKLMPKWKPGMLYGEIVRSKFLLPFYFKLN